MSSWIGRSKEYFIFELFEDTLSKSDFAGNVGWFCWIEQGARGEGGLQ